MKTHFGHALAHLMQLEGLTQAQLAETSGVDRPTISQYIHGHASPTRERLPKLCAAISTDRARRVELLLAHLRDEAEAAHAAGIGGADYVIAPQDTESADKFVVPLSLQATFGTLIDAAKSPAYPELRDMLEALAEMVMRADAREADRRSRYPEPALMALNVAEPSPADLKNAADAAISSTTQAVLKAAAPAQTPPRATARKRG